jgi:hypothetical protein
MLYRPGWLSSFLILLISAPKCSFVDGDADFESVRVRMTKDFSGRQGDPKAKYWREWENAMHFRTFELTDLMCR